jgi:1-acyl-sn-glycerol-3-phosphate acyltransferase
VSGPAVAARRVGWLFDGFRRYCVRYARRHFHAVRLSRGSAAIPADGPVLVAANHPGWWDPILCTILSREFGTRPHYGAIDARAIRKYPFFDRMGFFPVDARSLHGAAEFLRVGTALLADPRSVVWVTAQGEFADVRRRPLALRSGVGHLAARMTGGYVLPVAFEYTFWNERTPEALVRVGIPIRVADHLNSSGRAWTERIEAALTITLNCLNAEAQARNPAHFRPLVAGRTGVGGLYDGLRRMRAWVTGRRFDPGHGGTP